MKRGRPSLLAGALALLGACASNPPIEPAAPTSPEPQALELRVAGRDAPGFADPERRAKLEQAFPNISRAFAELRELEDVPALVVGVVIDGELA